jgi:hemoglobin
MTSRVWSATLLASVLLALSSCGRPAAQDAAAAPQPASTGSNPVSLYRRLGGYDALAAVADDILRRWTGDPDLLPFFQDLSTPEKQRVRQMLVDQLCAATGGPCVYVGQDMETAHRALEITAQDWDRAVIHVVATLNHFSIHPTERDELLTILGSVREQIVTR